jgi:hypothetical protein
MRTQKKLLETQSLATSTTLSPAATETSETKPDAPPRGSALLVETALTFARKIASAETLEQARDFARVIVDQLEEVNAKIKRQKTAAPTEDAAQRRTD